MPQTIEILRNSKIEYDDSEMDTLTKLEYDPCIVIMVKSKNKISEYNKELGNMFTDQDISWVGDNTLKKVSVEENFYTVQCSPEFSFKHFDLEYDKTNDLFVISTYPFGIYTSSKFSLGKLNSSCPDRLESKPLK